MSTPWSLTTSPLTPHSQTMAEIPMATAVPVAQAAPMQPQVHQGNPRYGTAPPTAMERFKALPPWQKAVVVIGIIYI